MNNIYREASEFFKGNKKYHRILREMAEKYKSLGSLGGSIELKNLTGEEKLILSKINSKFIGQRDARFSVKKFIGTFDGTKFEAIDFVEVLREYFGDEIKTNREIRDDKQRLKEGFFASVQSSFENTEAGRWLKAALEAKGFGYMIIIKEYESSREKLRETLLNVMVGINTLTQNRGKLTRLAIFASEITRNPHYFDSSELGGKLITAALAYLSNKEAPESSEEISELLYSFGILKDEISNHTTCCNALAYINGSEHMGVRSFYENNEPLQLNLWNLSRLEEIRCTGNTLFVFENPTVFTEVMTGTMDLKPSLLCTSGQLKLSSLVFMDKALKHVDKIYYSGDFDPEGINIAWRLKQRYGEKLYFWRFDKASYNKIKSNVELEDRRLKQIEHIEDEGLAELIAEIRDSRRCGYQELLIEEYVEDIRCQTKMP